MSDFSIQPAGHGPVNAVRNLPSLSHASPNGIHRTARFDTTAPHAADPGDRVELSDFARLLAKMRDMPDVRDDHVQRVRSAIDRGNYDTPERVDQAIDRMLQQEDLLTQ